MAEEPDTTNAPQTFYAMVQRMVKDPTLAKTLLAKVAKARTATTVAEQQAALSDIDKEFVLSADNLKDMGLPADFNTKACGVCTNTKPSLYLIEFATNASLNP